MRILTVCKEIRCSDLDGSVMEFLSGYAGDGVVYDRTAALLDELEVASERRLLPLRKPVKRRRKRAVVQAAPIVREVFRLGGRSALAVAKGGAS